MPSLSVGDFSLGFRDEAEQSSGQCDIHHKLTGMNRMSPALEEEDST
jgi:hypothetical protein